MLYEKKLKQSMEDKKRDKKEVNEYKKIYKHYLVQWKEIIKNASSRVQVVFGDVISKDSFSPEQAIKLTEFWQKCCEFK